MSEEDVVPPRAPEPRTADDFLAWLEPRIAMLPEAPGCWIWLGAWFPEGYGMLMRRAISSNPITAHRLVYTVLVGEIPESLSVLHYCDVPPCVRPTHLYVGTQADNMRDRAMRGRQRAARVSPLMRSI
jgi:hypothetical protein